MKKITQESIKHFIAGIKFNKGNMKVTIIGDMVYLELHGNIIASHKKGELFSNMTLSLCGYNTTTTRERLNGLLTYFGASKRFKQKNFAPYLIDIKTKQLTEIDASDILELKELM